jgi:hypothetical protein
MLATPQRYAKAGAFCAAKIALFRRFQLSFSAEYGNLVAAPPSPSQRD